jgi:two-component system, OmpR family, response regulator CpxR
MSVITVVGAAFSNKSSVVGELVAASSFRHIDPQRIIDAAVATSGMTETRLRGAFSAKTSVFNRFTHEKERSVAHLRLALAS